jgi:hypothetical protein
MTQGTADHGGSKFRNWSGRCQPLSLAVNEVVVHLGDEYFEGK